jgi:hypothetical protein
MHFSYMPAGRSSVLDPTCQSAGDARVLAVHKTFVCCIRGSRSPVFAPQPAACKVPWVRLNQLRTGRERVGGTGEGKEKGGGRCAAQRGLVSHADGWTGEPTVLSHPDGTRCVVVHNATASGTLFRWSGTIGGPVGEGETCASGRIKTG